MVIRKIYKKVLTKKQMFDINIEENNSLQI